MTPERRAELSRIRFRRAVTLLLMTLVMPGSAQLAAGRRTVGRVALRTWLLLLLASGLAFLVGLVWDGFVFWFAESPFRLGLVRALLIVLALGWAALFMDAWRLGQPLTLVRRQRLAVVGVHGLLCFSVVGALLFSAHLAGTGRDVLLTVFGGDKVMAETGGRYNVLLLGADSGKGRSGLRPDSITVASIDAESGRTVLIGLPRNLTNFRFAKGSVMAEQFPEGFDCDGCYLNAVATWALDNKELFPRSENPGVDATVEAVEGITGLDLTYWTLIDLAGFRQLVDAVGGVTLNVRDRIPVGLPHEDYFHYIEPGRKRLNGYDTLWFARAREGSDDYSRMARQKCVMNALLHQVEPQTVVRNFGKVAAAGKAMLTTNLPPEELSRFAQLAMKARSQKITTVSLVPPAVNTGDPDLDKIRRMVSTAVDRSEGKASGPGKVRKPRTTTGGSLGNLRQGYAANQADDLGAVC